MADIIQSGQRLDANALVTSRSGRYRLIMQADGNLVLYGPGRAVWASGTSGPAYAVMQADGNLVVYAEGGGALWDSGTWQHPGSRAVVQDDGNLVVYRQDGQPVWASGTAGARGPGLRIAAWNCFAAAKDPTENLRGLAAPLVEYDVALLCELERFTRAARGMDQPRLIADTAGFPFVATGTRFNWDGGERVDAILSRFPLRAIRTTPLPQQVLARLWPFNWGKSPGPRVLVDAVLDDPGGVGTLRVGSTRWTNTVTEENGNVVWDGSGDRLLQARDSVQLLVGSAEPVVWGGDLNDQRGAHAVEIALGSFADAIGVPPSAPDEVDFLLHRGMRASQPVRRSLPASDHPLLGAVFERIPAPPANSGYSGWSGPPLPDSIVASGDHISIRLEPGVAAAGMTEVVLRAAPAITWWKEVRCGTYRAWTQDDRRVDAFTIPSTQLAAMDLTLAKAGFLGFHRDAHQLTIPYAWKVDRSRITFTWLTD